MYHQIPQQLNGIDCGIFTIMYAKYLAARHEITFNQQDMGRFRRKIYDEISTKKLENIIWDNEEDWELPVHFTEFENVKTSRNKGKQNLYRSEETSDQGNQKKTQEQNLSDEFTSHENQNKKRRKSEPNLYPSQYPSYEGCKIYKFDNPGTNLCFSNAVTSVILNIQGFQEMLEGNITTLNQNSVFRELKKISQLHNNTNSSTKNLRRKIQEKCIENHQNTKNFDNNRQHDAAEFMSSLLEHMLYDEIEVMLRLFGQTQERLFCTNRECNRADHSPSNMVNIVAIPIIGTTLHMCLDEYLSQHEIERNCPNCQSQRASQVTEFISEPTLLIFQLNRFNYSETTRRIIKMHNQISVPTMIQLPSGGSFQIVGAIFHYGPTPSSGTPVEM